MGKVGKILSAEQKAIALSNNLSLQTVYLRLSRGWDIDRAVSEAPRNKYQVSRGESGEILSEGKGKIRSFRVPAEIDSEVDRLIAESGLSQSEWAGSAVYAWVKSQKKSPRVAFGGEKLRFVKTNHLR